MGARITPVPVPLKASDINPSVLSPGDTVTVEAKAPTQSLTAWFNSALAILGAIMAFATAFKALNFAASVTNDPKLQERINLWVLIATIVIVLVCAANVYLRIFKTKQPIALS